MGFKENETENKGRVESQWLEIPRLAHRRSYVALLVHGLCIDSQIGVGCRG